MSTTRRRLGVAGVLVGVGAAGVGAAVAARRYAVGRARLGPDPQADEPFGELRGQSVPARTDDGVDLHVEIDGPRMPTAATPLTVVFCHGFTLNLDSWHYQRRDLRESLGGAARLVFWDQRSHGRSQRGPKGVTIERLGADLHTVLRAVAPPGHPVVLVGHSMGGMTIMALAERYPKLFGRQIVGTALISTSTGGLAKAALGLPPVFGTMFRTAAPGVLRTLGRSPRLVEGARRLGADAAFLATRRFAFVDRDVSPTLVDFLDRMISGTPIDVIADFHVALMAHDKRAALTALDAVPTLVLAGDHDRLTPPAHAQEIVDAVSSAELVEVTDCGHVPILEHPDLVHGELLGLLARAGLPAAGERTA